MFGQVLEQDVYNVFHVHIASIGESATVDVTYVNSEEDIRKFFTLEKDATGAELKYKILLQNNGVRAIIYNFRGKVTELKFAEKQFAVDGWVNVEALRIARVKYAKIVNIPVQTLAALDKAKFDEYALGAPQYPIVGDCRARYFEELRGYVDIEPLPDIPEQPLDLQRFSVPICLCRPAPEAPSKVSEIFGRWKQAKEAKIMAQIESMKQHLVVYNTKLKDLTTNEKQQLLTRLQQAEGWLITIPESDASPEIVVFYSMLLFLS